VGNGGPGSGGTGSRGVENEESGGKRGVWKTRGLVENAGSSGKRVVWWKTGGLSGKHGVPLFFAKIRTLFAKMRGQNFVS